MRFALTTTMVVAALCSSGCGSMQVRRVPASGAEVNGLRVQVPAAHDLVTVLHDEPSGERVVRFTRMILPATDEYYELDMTGGLFKARALAVTLNPNGTVKTYSFTTAAKIAEALQQAAEATSTVQDAVIKVEEAKKQPNPVEVENAKLEIEILNMMLKANREALKEGRPLPYPGIVGAD